MRTDRQVRAVASGAHEFRYGIGLNEPAEASVSEGYEFLVESTPSRERC